MERSGWIPVILFGSNGGIYMYMRCSCTLPPIPVNCILYLKIGLQDINFYQVRNTVAK